MISIVGILLGAENNFVQSDRHHVDLVVHISYYSRLSRVQRSTIVYRLSVRDLLPQEDQLGTVHWRSTQYRNQHRTVCQ
jgi:hypothetical protein